jgi:hypothetical protein
LAPIKIHFMKQEPNTAVLDRILDPLARQLTPAAARALVKFRADAATQARIADLADRCNEGTLNRAERAEYDSYVRAIDLIAVLQSKARRALGKPAARR